MEAESRSSTLEGWGDWSHDEKKNQQRSDYQVGDVGRTFLEE